MHLASALTVISGADQNQKSRLFSTHVFFFFFHFNLGTVFGLPLSDALRTDWCSAGQLKQGPQPGFGGLCAAPSDNADSSLEHKHQWNPLL